MILPIGHEEDGVRRLPWITFGVMILCLLAFFATGRHSLTANDDVRLSESVTQVVQYYLEHPYLELDEEFRQEFVADGGTSEEFQAMVEAYRMMAGPPPPVDVIATEQMELDRLVALAIGSYEGHPLARWGLVPDDFSIVGLMTHMFLHAGWLHLFGNMLILYLAGPFIEDVWGRPLFVAFYLGAGVVAALSHVALNAGSAVPMIGASGAIAGVMGAFLIRYRTTRIRFFYMIGFFIRGTFSAPAWIMLPLWFVQQVFFALLTKDLEDGGGVAYGAHLGGFIFGVIFAAVLAHMAVEERYISAALESKVNTTLIAHEGVDEALEIHAAGDAARAFELLREEARAHRGDLDIALAFWCVAQELGRESDAAPAMVAAIRELIRHGDTDQAVRSWEELAARVPDAKLDFPLVIRLVPVLQSRGKAQLATAVLRQALLDAAALPGAAAALKIASLAVDCDPALARAATRMALARADADADAQAEARGILARLQSGAGILPVDAG